MNKITISKTIPLALVALFVLAVTAFAQTDSPSPTPVKTTIAQARISRIIATADMEIARRLAALDALNTRVQAMIKLTADEKSSLSTTIQDQTKVLNDLKSKIDADTDLETLKTDAQSITKSYRIYILVIPQGRIIAAADRVETIAGQITTLSSKIKTKLTSLPDGTDKNSFQSTLSDLNAKVDDANTQAQAAIAEVTGLKPDDGNQTIMKSNTAALKDARSKIKAAVTDLQTARKDAQSIIQGLRTIMKTMPSMSPSPSASPSPSPSASPSTSPTP